MTGIGELALLLSLGLLIGLVLGGLGGGGAVLTVPLLVFVVGQEPLAATSSSLVIVGLAALTGVGSHLRAGTVRWRTGLALGAAGVPAAYVGSLVGAAVEPDLLLLLFAVVMVVAAGAMVRRRGPRPGALPVEGPEAGPAPAPPPATGTGGTQVVDRTETDADRRAGVLTVAGVGLGVGLLTGFLGVGGGFVVVPALVVLLGLPMRLAVGTSLVVVAVNSGAALLSRMTHTELEWSVVLPFAAAAMVATLLGRRASGRVPQASLQKAFAGLLVLVALYTGAEAVLALAA